jgi:hypothetical protein
MMDGGGARGGNGGACVRCFCCANTVVGFVGCTVTQPFVTFLLPMLSWREETAAR